MREQWLAEYFKNLSYYKIESNQEPLWLYRLLSLQRQEIDKRFKAELDSKKEFINNNVLNELDDSNFLILCILWKDEEIKNFSHLDRYVKIRLLNLAKSNQLIAFYATSLLITFLLRDSVVLSHRKLALQLLKEKDVEVIESANEKGVFTVAGKQSEEKYCLNGQGDLFSDPLTRTFVDLSYADFKGLSSDIKGMNFSCQYMLGLNAEGVIFKKNIFEDAYLGLANFSSATFKASECNRAVFPRAQFKDTSIINSHFRGVHFQVGCVSYLDHPKPAFEVLSKAGSLAGSYFSEQAFTAQEYQSLQVQKGKFHLVPDEKEDRADSLQMISEYTQEFIQYERADHQNASLNWPTDPTEWRHDLNWSDRPESRICDLNESRLLNLLRFTVHATSDNCNYRSRRFEFSRGKKGF